MWPTEIAVRGKGTVLALSFDNGMSGTVTAELLRVESPSAEVRGHGPGQEQLVWGKRYVRISRVEPVGNYAIRLIFDDGHATGIYTWTYLGKLMTESLILFADYEKKLASAGLSRG